MSETCSNTACSACNDREGPQMSGHHKPLLSRQPCRTDHMLLFIPHCNYNLSMMFSSPDPRTTLTLHWHTLHHRVFSTSSRALVIRPPIPLVVPSQLNSYTYCNIVRVLDIRPSRFHGQFSLDTTVGLISGKHCTIMRAPRRLLASQ